MKGFKTIVAVVLFASVSSFAGLDLMVGGGLNLSNIGMSGDYKLGDGDEKSMRIGFNAGANLLIPFNEKMGIVAGLNYETRGAVMKTTFMGTSSKATTSMNYLQIPILFSFKPIPELGINLGPEFGIFLGGKMVPDEGESIDLKDVSTLDLGLSIGANYTIAKMIMVGAGYYLGFLNTDNSSVPAGMSRSGSMTNNNIKIFVAYVFHFGGE